MLNKHHPIREQIEKAAYELFRKQGLTCVSMTDVAAELGMSKNTLYSHYRNKEDLIFHSMKHQSAVRDRHRKKILNEHKQVIDGMVALMQFGVRQLEKINPVLFEQMRRNYPRLYETIQKETSSRIYNDITALLEKGKHEGWFLEEVNSDIVARLFGEQMRQLVNYELFPVTEYPRPELFRHIFLHFMRGITTAKGRRRIDQLVDHYQTFRDGSGPVTTATQ
ncbi:TetR/AcrR family transcriptional regulator [Natronogracilivirga saccharolytica]|uniref:TetR/AcrR family transcriptional regulator n=1 Tax=Natronogracilivirga saccharolytica TaxID=2812953 RepID=A0A8J7RN37_9BACT|nr:TetR/AcrR family transcriptional regulator [Natronogracilivirga saccharolytica]MBP3192769.1 TetR/AcrR family transcriptional regulator [Natronogracilivirga saccharolytica]